MRELTKVKGKFKGNEVQMQREIKFRAWDSGTKKMIYDFDTEFSGFKCQSDDNRKYMTYLNCEGELIIDDNGVKNSKNIVLMQFTGLKDKMGKDIYEGDIVNVMSGDKNFEVFFATGCFRIDRIIGSNMCSSMILGDYSEDIEVIGNLYENPELLKSIKVATVGNNKVVQRIRTRK